MKFIFTLKSESMVVCRFIPVIIFLSLAVAPFSATQLSANPFFSGKNNIKSASPPPVYTGGMNSFIKLQFEYRDKIALLMRDIKNGEGSGNFLMFMAASFLYGLFHAAGPGHRKTIVFSLFISHRVRWYEPAFAGFLSAGIHAGTSAAVIAVLYLMRNTIISLSGSEEIYAHMEGVTFITISLLAFAFIGVRIKSLISSNVNKTEKIPQRLYPLIIITSLVPCPGATMLLLLSLYSDMPGTGAAGVAAMSAGMGIVISFAGYLAYAGRAGLFFRLKQKERLLSVISALLEILSFIIIMLFSLLMSWPFIRSIADTLLN